MIIKSMARKDPNFGQLIDYMASIDKSEERYNVYQNLYSRKLEDMEQEFQENAAFMAKRKNGNQMYHEILSITKAQKLAEQRQKEILRDIAREYAQYRAKDNLVFGALHDDHDDHLHYHLLISANAVGESRKTRLSKAQFDRFKKDMEARVLKNYPELEQRVVINQTAEEKLSNKGHERKRRTGKVPERDQLKAKLHDIFQNVQSKEAFFSALHEAGLEFYARGKTLGVKDLATERKHRLKTLGVLQAFEDMSARIELDESQKKDKKAEKDAKTEKPTEQAKQGRTEDSAGEKKKEAKADTSESREDSPRQDQPEPSALEKEQARRKAEMEDIRREQNAQNNQDSEGDKKQ